MRLPRSPLLLLPLCACAPATDPTTANTGAGLPVELVFCRADVVHPFTVSEIAARTATNLGTARVPERNGRELHVRVHPNGKQVVFARERTPGVEASRELFVASIDGALPEVRLTGNNVADDTPCWSPAGDAVLFGTTRDGDSRLYVCAPDGGGQQPFLLAGAGIEDRDPDWCRATGRIVFSRREANGVRRLYLVNGDGTGETPLTAGAPAGGAAEAGDREGTFSPDGRQVAFVRFSGLGRSRLLLADVDTGDVHELFDPLGGARLPRFSPAGDRLFFGLDQPDQGRAGPRLAALPLAGGQPLLVEPGEQWLLDGVDVLPAMPPAPKADAPIDLDVTAAEIQIASGTLVGGNPASLRAVDGDVIALATATFEDHEIAAINCRFTLPVAAPGDVLALLVRIVAGVTRADGDTALRSSLHNPVAERFDTVVELPSPGTAMRTMTFATQSLAHVSNERQVRFTVIGEIGAGARAELHVDQVLLTLVRRAGT